MFCLFMWGVEYIWVCPFVVLLKVLCIASRVTVYSRYRTVCRPILDFADYFKDEIVVTMKLQIIFGPNVLFARTLSGLNM